MKKLFSILLLFVVLNTLGQTTQTFNTLLKFKNVPTGTTEEYVLVKGADDIVRKVLKSSIGSTPSWNSTLSINSTAEQNVTILDPYNLYLRNGHLKLWHNIDADYADISIGSGYWKFNNSQFQDFEITPQGFATFKYGGFYAAFDNSALTGNVNLGIPNVNGTLLTTAGTEASNPITGNIEFSSSELKLFTEVSGDTFSVSPYYGGVGAFDVGANLSLQNSSRVISCGVDSNKFSTKYTDISTGEFCAIELPSTLGFVLNSTNSASYGIRGTVDFSANVTSLDFPQVSYINKRFAGYLESGLAINGDLTIDIGDVGCANNCTTITVNDNDNSFQVNASTIFNKSVFFQSPTGSFVTELVNDDDVSDKTLLLPTSAGRLINDTELAIRFAAYKETGTALGGDLVLDLGDVSGNYNSTRILINDADNEITLFGSVLADAEISFRGPTSSNYANLVNDSDVSRALTLPIAAGRIALESKMVQKTTAQINALTGMQAGDYYFNTTLSTICFYNGTAWKKVNESPM